VHVCICACEHVSMCACVHVCMGACICVWHKVFSLIVMHANLSSKMSVEGRYEFGF